MSELNENLIQAVTVSLSDGPVTKVTTPLTLRDFFAAFALAGMVASDEYPGDYKMKSETAYRFAKAMLAERKKTE